MTVSKQVLDIFVREAKEPNNHREELAQCLATAKAHRSAIKNAKNTGSKCRKQAVWIGLER
jgi:hypothetical protein